MKSDLNPLRQGLRLERVPDPCAFVLFGATGDLAHRKVIPAIYQLWRTNLLPAEFSLVAVARRPYSDEAFAAEVRASVEKYSRVQPVDEAAWAELAGRITYQQLDFSDDAGFDRLSERLDELDKERGLAGNRLYYLATQPSQVTEIVRQLGRVGPGPRAARRRLAASRRREAFRPRPRIGPSRSTTRWTRFSASRRSIASTITWARRRSATCSSSASATGSSSRSGTAATSITCRSRWPSRSASRTAAAFYEETGASRDILQNHLLQLMTLVAMEPPSSFQADALRDQKLQVLRAIAAPDPEQVRRNVVRGQYGPGWVAGEAAAGLPPGARGRSRVRDRDLRRRPIRDRRLALERRPVLPAGRQAAAQARHGDRDPVQGSTAAALPRIARRPGPERPGDANPARRGNHAALRGQGTGTRPGRADGEHGLRLRHLVHGRLAGRLRNADPRRPPG